MAQRAETTVAECSLTSCVWTHFPAGSHSLPGRHSQPTPTSLDQEFMRVVITHEMNGKQVLRSELCDAMYEFSSVYEASKRKIAVRVQKKEEIKHTKG